MDTADTHAVGLKLPVVWVDHLRVWLQQAEAQFAVRNVTADNTKYHYVVAALDHATALRVIDVLEDPPPQHNKYDNLRRRLTDIFGLSRRQRADQLLDIGLHSLGDRRPSQLMDEMLALLGSHKPCMLFESIFLRRQIPVAADDVSKTAVITPFGLFEFLRTPFGLKNAAQAFQRLMDTVCNGLDFVFVYLDDILVSSTSAEQHMLHLREVFHRLSTHGLVINVSKCKFGATIIDYLLQ